MPATSSAQRRIARLATLTTVHRAFHWLHLHQPQLRQWQLELVRIPAPPQLRVPHVRDSFIVANVGMITFLEPPPPNPHPAETFETAASKVKLDT
jgi:hypothetical protein